MRLLAVMSISLLLVSSSWAQEERNIVSATSALQDVLSTLKDSVDKLSVDNDQLAARDKSMKQQMAQLQMRLGSLRQEGDRLNQAAGKFQNSNPRRARQITELEGESFDWDNRIKKAQDSIALIQQSLDEKYKQDQALLLQLKDLTGATLPAAPQAPSLESQTALQVQLEKLKLMKMIADSQDRQAALQQSILDYQKSKSMLPQAAAINQQLVQDQINALQAQAAALPTPSIPVKLGSANQGDGLQAKELQLELKVLAKNYGQLKDLINQMDKKAGITKMSAEQHAQEEKLQGSLENLNHQSAGLRAQLDDLRSQMIDLDKRKTSLEEMIKKLP